MLYIYNYTYEYSKNSIFFQSQYAELTCFAKVRTILNAQEH